MEKKIVKNLIITICTMVMTLAVMSTNAYAKEKTYTVNGEKIKFDADYYSNTYADVKNALGTDEMVLLNHYLTYGRKEGRKPYANASTAEPSKKDSSKAVTSKIDTSKVQQALLAEINRMRKSAGISPLKSSSELNSVASVRVKEIANNYSHTRPDGTDFITAFTAVNEKYAAPDNQIGENVVMCSTSGKDTTTVAGNQLQTLKDSADHYNRMMSSDFNYVGIASYQIGDKNYVIFEFATK